MQEENSQNQQKDPQQNTNPKQTHEETASDSDNGGGGQPPNKIPQEEPSEPFGNDRSENEERANIIAAEANDIAREANDIAREANRIAGKSNNISWLNFIGSSIIVVFTGLLLIKTIQSTDAAITAANAAVDANRHQRFNDSLNRIESAKSSYTDSINMAKRFEMDSISRDLQNKSVAAQMQSLKETQRQFEVENRPFIQVYDIKVDTMGLNGMLNFKVINYGKFPAEVLYVKYRIWVALSVNPTKIVYMGWQKNERKTYVAAGVNYLPEFNFMEATSNDAIKAMRNSEIIMYLDAEIKYKSYGTKHSFLHTSLNKILLRQHYKHYKK